jgi:hypothetical protein
VYIDVQRGFSLVLQDCIYHVFYQINPSLCYWLILYHHAQQSQSYTSNRCFVFFSCSPDVHMMARSTQLLPLSEEPLVFCIPYGCSRFAVKTFL